METLIQKFSLFQAVWVLYFLIGLSIFSITIIFERFLFFTLTEVNLSHLRENLMSCLARGELTQFAEKSGKKRATEVIVLSEGIAHIHMGVESVQEMMSSVLLRERLRLERFVSFLGTIGNNAPFIGLFGTVLGIIRAFRELAIAQTGGAQTVLAGIAEALIATAVGLFVAIPAVLAYNYFQRRIKRVITNTESLMRVLLAYMKREETADAGES